MSNTEQRVPKIKLRATQEINVVKDCKQDFETRADERKRKLEEANARMGVLEALGGNTTNEDELDRIANEMAELEENIEYYKEDYENFTATAKMFGDLLRDLESFYVNNQFKFIVKKIPEKKLRALADNPNKMEKLIKLLMSIQKAADRLKERKKHGSKVHIQERTEAKGLHRATMELGEVPNNKVEQIKARLRQSSSAQSSAQAPEQAQTYRPNRNDS